MQLSRISNIESLEPRRLLSVAYPSAPAQRIPVTSGSVPSMVLATSKLNENLSWQAITDSPIKRYEMQKAVLNGKIYLFGGLYNSDYKASLRADVYNPQTDTYTRLRDLPKLLTHAQTVVVNSEIWLIGGFVGHHPGLPTKDVWIYNPQSDTYRKGPSLVEANGAGGAGLVNNTIIYFGGQKRDPKTGNETGNIAKAWKLDLSSTNPKWVRVKDMPGARNHFGSVVIGKYVYAVGGQNGGDEWYQNSSRVDRYDVTTNTWTRLKDLPTGRGHSNENTVVAEGKIYLIGGAGNVPSKAQSNARSTVFRYDPDSNTWQTLNNAPVARKNATVAYIDAYLYLIGGGDWKGAYSQAYRAQLLTTDAEGQTPPSTGSSSISGFLWNDTDADGVVDSNESRTGRRTVFLDQNRNGKLDSGEKSTTSDSQGNYRFTGLSAGTYYVTRVFPSGYRLSNDPNGYRTVSIFSNQNIIDIHLGTTNKPGTSTPPSDGTAVWFKASSLPIKLGETSGGVINGKLYIIGDGSSRVYRYDLNTNTWTTLAARSVSAKDQVAEVVNGKLYVFGGVRYLSTGQQVLTTAQVYDPATNKWSNLKNMPYAMAAGQTAVIGGKIYIAGGFTTGNVTTDRVIRYDPASNAYTELARMPRKLDSGASGTDGSKLYIFGGRDVGDRPGNGYAQTLVYNPDTNSWSTNAAQPLPVGRGGISKAPFINGEFYIIGGETDSKYSETGSDGVYDRVDIYNPSTNRWRVGPPIPTDRHGIAPLVLNNRIYVAGGGIVQGKSETSVVEYLQLP
ncbi:MAG: hypothetical protein KatS3mg104_0998 [Phycisphaerae bacterium]|nr:MAG: hypothetical protein KatS3mg104_0998 [Phycisphaerae bacterium]